MRLYYSPDYVASGHAFDTTRKAAWIAESLGVRPIPGVTLCTPEPVTEAELCELHEPPYVRAVRTGEPRALAQSQGFRWDPGLWTAVCASTGGTVSAALAALAEGVSGSLSSGLHHARRSQGSGFCTFNGLVLAARTALAKGAQSILILDLDAHCGGGTHSLIAGDRRIHQLDVSVSAFDSYVPARGNTLDMVYNASDYLPTISARLKNLEVNRPSFALCLYNAGMDPYQGSAIGAASGMTREILQAREQLVFGWCKRHGIPIAFVLAGGYVGDELDEAGLVDLHRLTVLAAVQQNS